MSRECCEFGSIRKHTSGRHQAVYTGPNLLRHGPPTTFRAKVDAEGWLYYGHKLIEDTGWSPRSIGPRRPARGRRRQTSVTYASKWITKRRIDKGEPPRVNQEERLEHNLEPTFGRMRLRSITKGAARRCKVGTLGATATAPRPTRRPTGYCEPS